MLKLSFAAVGLIGAAALLGSNSAQAAVTLLSLKPVPGQSNQEYEIGFMATGAKTTISIGGYQKYSYEYVSQISVTGDEGPNLLGTSWTFMRAMSGSDANTVPDGTSVPALWFGGLPPKSGNDQIDTFSQTFSTNPGAEYWLKFDLTNNALARLGESFNVSALEVTTTAQVARPIPEPSTWLMMLLGFGGLAWLATGVRSRFVVSAALTDWLDLREDLAICNGAALGPLGPLPRERESGPRTKGAGLRPAAGLARGGERLVAAREALDHRPVGRRFLRLAPLRGALDMLDQAPLGSSYTPGGRRHSTLMCLN